MSPHHLGKFYNHSLSYCMKVSKSSFASSPVFEYKLSQHLLCAELSVVGALRALLLGSSSLGTSALLHLAVL